MKNYLVYQLLLLMCFSVFTLTAYAQKDISGKVLDEKGEPLIGVNVVVKGTSVGTATDIDGNYKISVPADGTTLVFSFISYDTKEVEIGTQTTINVSMKLDMKILDEVVVVGYTTQRKKDVTGSATNLSEKDLNAGTITNPLQQMTGRAAGVNITQVGSEPGVAPTVRIRGITSLIGGNDPLVVVDGIQGGMDLLAQVPPSEIKSIDILKDASATAIYGSRGAAGVILVTTKKGEAGATTIEYGVIGSVELIAKQYDMMSADEWRSAAAGRGLSGGDFGGNTDWVDQIMQTGYTQNHNLAFGGGNAKFNYRASLTAIDQRGLIINSGFQNFIGRIQATQYGLNDKLSLTYNVNASTSENQYNNGGVLNGAIKARPTDPIYDENGDYFIDPNAFDYTNAYARAKEVVDGEKNDRLFGSLRANLEIIEGLNVTGFGSWRRSNKNYGNYFGVSTTDVEAVRQNGRAELKNESRDEKLFNMILGYRRTFGDHALDVSGIYEWQRSTYSEFTSKARGFANDLLQNNSLQSGNLDKAQLKDVESKKNEQTLVSFVARANYSYKEKYMATATMRRDGSSKFGTGNKWANFPSVSLAWRISEEAFLDGVSAVNDLKLRAGFGVTGNQQGLDPLQSIRLVGPDGTAFFGGSLIPNYSINQNANSDLRWETREMFNAGLDFTLLNGKLSGTVDYYNGSTKDLLFNYTVPQPPFPHGEIKANVGEVLNEGLEISLSYNVISTDDMQFTLSGNFTTNRTEVQKLSGEINGVPLNTNFVRWGGGGTTGVASTNNGVVYLIEGQPLGAFYLFQHESISDNGTQVVRDVDGNGSIEDGDRSADRAISGQALPKFTYALTPTFSYKNFDVSMVVRGVSGNKVYNARRAQLSALGELGIGNVLSDALETNIRNVTYASDLWLEDGSFVRMENLTLGYGFGDMGVLKNMRLSFTAANLFVISGYSGLDPEVRMDGGSNNGEGFGTDFGIFPRTRSFALGLNVSF